MKKILLIAYHYYPDLQVGAQRTIKYVKYLPQFGWEPHVLSVDPRHYPQVDDAPLGFDCPVYRTSRWPLPDDIYRWLKRTFSGNRQQAASSGEAPVGNSKPAQESTVPVWKKFLNSLSMTPDNFSGWYFPAVLAARRLIRKHGYDVIYSSGPPQTCHMVGLTAHRLTGTPWVADFRDPWLFPKGRDRFVLEWTKNFDIKYEAQTARFASLVITTTDEWRDHLKQLYHPLLEDKCHTIINGFDTDDFETTCGKHSRDGSEPVTFLYAGNLYAGRDPSAMLKAAGELVSEGFIAAGEIAFEFYGNSDIDMNHINRITSDYSLQSCVRFNSPVGRDQYLKLLREADVLILIQAATGRVHIPAKAFEYLGTGNEILTLTSEGATRNFMSGFDNVSLAELDNEGEIKAAMKHLITRVKNGTVSASNDEKLQGITKRALTEKFAGLLDNLTTNKQ